MNTQPSPELGKVKKLRKRSADVYPLLGRLFWLFEGHIPTWPLGMGTTFTLLKTKGAVAAVGARKHIRSSFSQ